MIDINCSYDYLNKAFDNSPEGLYNELSVFIGRSIDNFNVCEIQIDNVLRSFRSNALLIGTKEDLPVYSKIIRSPELCPLIPSLPNAISFFKVSDHKFIPTIEELWQILTSSGLDKFF